MKAKDLKNLSKSDLENKLVEIKKELMMDYAQISAGTPPKSPGMLKQRKKTIARILTIIRSKSDQKTEVNSKQ